MHNETAAKGTVVSEKNEGVSGLEGAPVDKRFGSLDEYLDWLRRMQAPVDGSWYEEVGPGLYKLRTGNLRVLGTEGDETPRERTYTRAELEKKFGFTR